MLDTIKLLWNYHFWSLEQIKRSIEDFSEEEFSKDLGDGCGSVKDKLVHILAADKIWLARIKKRNETFLQSSEIKDKSEYLELLKKVQDEFKDLLSQLQEKDLIELSYYKNLRGMEYSTPLKEILLHVANHGTYHRGQVASLIRRVKGKPPVTDLIEYFRASK
jgi:uncharacterized damage-inducible protein DinB